MAIRWRRARFAAAAVSAAAAITLLPSVGHADPATTIAQVEARVQTLQHEAEVAQERLNQANVRVAQTKRDLSTLRRQLGKQRSDVSALQQQMDAFASATYVNGGVDSSLQLIMAEDPTAFLDEAASLSQVSRVQDSAMRQMDTAQLGLRQAQLRVTQQLTKLTSLQKNASDARAQVNARLSDMKQLLSSLKAAQQRRLAALEAQRQQAAAGASRGATRGPATTSPSLPSGSSVPVDGRAAAAVAFARAQVGKSYVYGAAGPDSFDCSGLTMMAWNAAGVSLPHSAAAQYSVTARVDMSSIQPGDLMFFYSPISHVGIYIGGGYMVDAANPTSGIRVDPVGSGSYYAGVLAGIGRP